MLQSPRIPPSIDWTTDRVVDRRGIRWLPLVTIVGAIAVASCAATGQEKPGTGSKGSGTANGSSGGDDGTGTGPIGSFGTNGDDSGVPSDAKAARPQRCDEAGRCTCFNVASIGQPGHTGFQGGQDSTTAFTDYLNAQSSAQVDLYTSRPTLDAAFLAKYDVLIIQWLVDGVSSGTGTGYWTFTASELAALKSWVEGGGGLIALSGYDASSEEVTPLNQLMQAVSDLSYGTADVLGTTGDYCLGESDPLGGWVQTTPIGKHIDEVGAFHGRPVDPGSKATGDCSDGTNVYAAHEDVGSGHVFAYADEWVTYTSQWFGIDAGAGCADASADVVYQVPQFWFNAISYASQATACPFTLTGPITR
jgi:hypothetical protein